MMTPASIPEKTSSQGRNTGRRALIYGFCVSDHGSQQKLSFSRNHRGRAAGIKAAAHKFNGQWRCMPCQGQTFWRGTGEYPGKERRKDLAITGARADQRHAIFDGLHSWRIQLRQRPVELTVLTPAPRQLATKREGSSSRNRWVQWRILPELDHSKKVAHSGMDAHDNFRSWPLRLVILP